MSLVFPDVNVWVALSIEHVHGRPALRWWQEETGPIAFCRFTQLGLLRLLTTPAVMSGKPLTMQEAWKTYDRFFADERVQFVAEPAGIDPPLRRLSSARRSSSKLWADAYVLAFAEQSGGVVVTFDRALADCAPSVVVLS